MKKALIFSLMVFSFSLLATTMSKTTIKGFSTLKTGEFNSVSMSIDGNLTLSRELKKVKSLNDTFGWDFVYYKNALYITSGEKGKILKYDFKTKEISLLTAFDEGTVYAIAICNGKLYAGLSPKGIVYKVNLTDGKYSKFFDTKAKYIWNIKVKNNKFYITTGLPGKLIKLDENGVSEILSKDFDKHYESIEFGKDGIYLGTYPTGSIVKVKNGKSFLVYQSKYKEIKDLEFFNGKLYAICYSGNPTIKKEIKQKPARKIIPFISFRGAIVSIDKNNVPEVLYSLRKVAPFCLKAFHHKLYVGTGHSGKILTIDNKDRLSIFGEVDNGQVMRIINLNGTLYLLTSNSSEIYSLSQDFALEGTYISDIIDAGNTSTWGAIYFDYQAPVGTREVFYVRGGNSDSPDLTWGNWIKIESGEKPDIPATTMLQFKVKLISHDPSLSPVFKGVSIYYREANLKPFLIYKTLSPQCVRIAKKVNKNKDFTPTYKAFVNKHRSPIGLVFGFDPAYISFYVKAKDPNEDKLKYSFYLVFKSGKKVEIEKDGDKNYISLNTLAYPEGTYRFYYTISDRESNYPNGYTIDGYSDYFTIDNTPPKVSNINFTGKSLSFTAKDSSPVEVVKISTDGGKSFKNVYSVDGINDQGIENFNINFDKKADSAIIFVEDSCGNSKTYLAK